MLSPFGSVSTTTRFLLHNSSCVEGTFSAAADAVRGLNVAKESLESGELSRRDGCVGSKRPTAVPDIDIVCEGPDVCMV